MGAESAQQYLQEAHQQLSAALEGQPQDESLGLALDRCEDELDQL